MRTPNDRPSRQIAIIGAGASGVILAREILAFEDPDLRVVLIEKAERPGRGLAYATDEVQHLLNVNSRAMSAVAEQPLHFQQWLVEQDHVGSLEEGVFAPRAHYGQYLESILHKLLADHRSSGRLRLVDQEVISIGKADHAVDVRLADGTSIPAHHAVLATGHDGGPRIDGASELNGPLPDRHSTIMILGTGLSMVDAWLSLRERGHQGPILAVSRRGLLPTRQKASTALRLDSADVPLGTSLPYFMRWLRALVADTEARGGDWRDVVNGLRPYNQMIWQAWPERTRRRFLEHTRAWWDVHRHRIAPQLHDRLKTALRGGDLNVIPGRLVDHVETADGIVVRLRGRRDPDEREVTVTRLYDCSGMARNPADSIRPLVRQLLADGHARPDVLGIGLDVDRDGRVIDAKGQASGRLHAIGPASRAAFFEIESIPEIREQCVRVAGRLAQRSPDRKALIAGG